MTTILTKQDCERVIEYFVDKSLTLGCQLRCIKELNEVKEGDLLTHLASGKISKVLTENFTSMRGDPIYFILKNETQSKKKDAVVVPNELAFANHYAIIGHPTLKCHVEQKISDLLDTKSNGEFECLEKLTRLWQPLGFTTSLQDVVAGIKWESKVTSCPDGNRKCLTLHRTQVAKPSPNTDLLLFLKELI